jgi:hypothetical protein
VAIAGSEDGVCRGRLTAVQTGQLRTVWISLRPARARSRRAMLAPMRSNEIFAQMTTEQAAAFLDEVKREARPVAQLALGATAQAFRLRLEFLKRQPKLRQAEWMRKALGRTIGAPFAEEVLASYFLEHHLDLLKEWLDLAGIEHEDGQIKSESLSNPGQQIVQTAVEKFRQGDQPERRELLLRAFAAQSAVDWPDLETLVCPPSGGA